MPANRIRPAPLLLLLLLAATTVACAPTVNSAPDRDLANSSAGASGNVAPPAAAPPARGAPAAQPGAATESVLRTFKIIPAQSETSYEVQEKFARLPAPNKAVGRTRAIEGQFQLETGAAPRLLTNNFSVDLRTLTSDSSRRDGLIRDQWLESNRFPMAEFSATRIDPLPIGYVEGQEAVVKIIGNMKIRDVTRELTFDARVKLEGNRFTGTATTFLLMRDFGFDPPDILGIVSVEDGVTLTVNFTAEAGA